MFIRGADLGPLMPAAHTLGVFRRRDPDGYPTPLERPILPESRSQALPAAGVRLLHLGPGEEHRSVGHELAIEMTGVTWYLAPGDVFTPAADAYVVTALSS